MIRGSTPIHRFTFPESLVEFGLTEIQIVYYQRGRIVLVKNLNDFALVGTTLEVPLTQEDTLSFDESGSLNDVKIQLFVKAKNGTVLASNVVYTRVTASLLDGVN